MRYSGAVATISGDGGCSRWDVRTQLKDMEHGTDANGARGERHGRLLGDDRERADFLLGESRVIRLVRI